MLSFPTETVSAAVYIYSTLTALLSPLSVCSAISGTVLCPSLCIYWEIWTLHYLKQPTAGPVTEAERLCISELLSCSPFICPMTVCCDKCFRNDTWDDRGGKLLSTAPSVSWDTVLSIKEEYLQRDKNAGHPKSMYYRPQNPSNYKKKIVIWIKNLHRSARCARIYFIRQIWGTSKANAKFWIERRLCDTML